MKEGATVFKTNFEVNYVDPKSKQRTMYEVTEASSKEEALRIFMQKHPEVTVTIEVEEVGSIFS
jgi:hypothetical protein